MTAIIETWRAALQEPLPEEAGACRNTVGFLRGFSWYLVLFVVVGTVYLLSSVFLMFTGAQIGLLGDSAPWIFVIAALSVLVSFLGLGGAFLYWAGWIILRWREQDRRTLSNLVGLGAILVLWGLVNLPTVVRDVAGGDVGRSIVLLVFVPGGPGVLGGLVFGTAFLALWARPAVRARFSP